LLLQLPDLLGLLFRDAVQLHDLVLKLQHLVVEIGIAGRRLPGRGITAGVGRWLPGRRIAARLHDLDLGGRGQREQRCSERQKQTAHCRCQGFSSTRRLRW
jgi:hypothetical protein